MSRQVDVRGPLLAFQWIVHFKPVMFILGSDMLHDEASSTTPSKAAAAAAAAAAADNDEFEFASRSVTNAETPRLDCFFNSIEIGERFLISAKQTY